MSYEPPRQPGKGIPGSIVLLGVVAFVLLVVVLIFGALMLGIGPAGNNEPTHGETVSGLAASGFHAESPLERDGETTIDVTFHVTNNTDATIGDTQVLVQCQDDAGYVSAIKLLPDLDARQTVDVAMTLNGTGHPSCRQPVIDFSPVATSGRNAPVHDG